jgi:hypothetical protein
VISQDEFQITPLASASEKILTTCTTVTKINGEVEASIPTDSNLITNSTIIAALLLETNWVTGIYTGTTTGAVEGQFYIQDKYLYIYKDSTFRRINISRDSTTTITDTYTQLGTDNTIICNKATDFTLTLLPSANFTDFTLTIKNINTGVVTIDANTAETIDGQLVQYLYQWDCIKLYTNGTNWFII